MRATSVIGAAILFMAGTAIVAAEIESGVQVGGRIGTYRQTKCSGNDGFGKEGDAFCYT